MSSPSASKLIRLIENGYHVVPYDLDSTISVDTPDDFIKVLDYLTLVTSENSVFFDFDGVLIDSLPCMEYAWSNVQ